MFSALRLPFISALFRPTSAAQNRLKTYCITIESPALGWLRQRLEATIRFRVDKVLIESDIEDLKKREGESDALQRARLAGGFTFCLFDLCDLSYMIRELDDDGGLLIVSQEDLYLLNAWLDHEVDLLRYWPGRYEPINGLSVTSTLTEFNRLCDQIKGRMLVVDMTWPARPGIPNR